MRFFSDNAAPACPEVIAALVEANVQDTAYDGDAWSARLDARFSELFDTEVAVLWVPTGTAANCLALTALCPPYGGVVCHREAHIQADEAGAPEFFTHGAKLLLAEGAGAKLNPEAIRAVIDAIKPGVHWVQPHAISITNATEYGLVYTPAEVSAIGELARSRGLKLHMDGARFANAAAHLGCAPAEVTWRAGVDALSFGFIKNGGLSAEALVFSDPALAELFDTEVAVLWVPTGTAASAPGTSSPRAASSPRSCWRCSTTTCGYATPARPMPERRCLRRRRRVGWSTRSNRTACSCALRLKRQHRFARAASISTTGGQARRG
jgi:threonine aldolase